MYLCLAVIAAVAIIAAAISAYIIRSSSNQYEARLVDARSQLTRAYARIEHLELTIDEIRARDLSTSLPPVPAAQATRVPLPEEIQQELLMIEDSDHRAELEEKARYDLEQNPDADPKQIAAEMFI